MHMFALNLLTAILVDSRLGGFANATENRKNAIENSNMEPSNLWFCAHPYSQQHSSHLSILKQQVH